MSGVRQVSACSTFPSYGMSGNNVAVPGGESRLFNIADLFTVADHYFGILQTPIIAGRVFTSGSDSFKQVMVGQDFAFMMKELHGWDDVVGQKVTISGHSGNENKDLLAIIGVYRDIHLGSAENSGRGKPSVIFCGRMVNWMNNYLLVQLSDFSIEKLIDIRARLQRFLPGKAVLVRGVKDLKNM